MGREHQQERAVITDLPPTPPHPNPTPLDPTPRHPHRPHLLGVHPKVFDLVQRDCLVLARPLLGRLVALQQQQRGAEWCGVVRCVEAGEVQRFLAAGGGQGTAPQ